MTQITDVLVTFDDETWVSLVDMALLNSLAPRKITLGTIPLEGVKSARLVTTEVSDG